LSVCRCWVNTTEGSSGSRSSNGTTGSCSCLQWLKHEPAIAKAAHLCWEVVASAYCWRSCAPCALTIFSLHASTAASNMLPSHVAAVCNMAYEAFPCAWKRSCSLIAYIIVRQTERGLPGRGLERPSSCWKFGRTRCPCAARWQSCHQCSHLQQQQQQCRHVATCLLVLCLCSQFSSKQMLGARHAQGVVLHSCAAQPPTQRTTHNTNLL
jgi:hypothetical protein